MAHKVLPKDMHELVEAMKLAQQYNDTTLDKEYKKQVSKCGISPLGTYQFMFFASLFRGMLSAAHVLAMDAKNLLDVVDTIKQRYEHIFIEYFQPNLVNSL